MPSRRDALFALTLLATLPRAEAAAQPAPAQPQSPSPDPTQKEPSFIADLFAPSRGNLLGDMGGVRAALGDYGISIGLQSTNEVFGNVSGGIQQGWSGNGMTQFGAGLDTRKAFGWEGGTFNLSGFWIYGPNFSQNYLGVLQTASGIVAQPTVRLWEIWYQQELLHGKMDVKVGQQSLDQEFMTSQGSSLFLNTMMGWPMTPAANLYAGGPTYPLSSLGVRLRGQPGGNVTLLGGVFQDNPPGGPFDNDSQLRGSTRWGGNFNLRTGALFIAEIQYAHNQPVDGPRDTQGTRPGLPGIYKLGVWYDTAKFHDRRLDVTGVSLADPTAYGVGKSRWGNFSVYAVMDQMIWRPDPEEAMAVGVFLRPVVAPADRNLINFSVNGGVTLKAPLPGRDNDTFGIGFGVANVSPRARGLDRDTAYFSGAYVPARGAETFLEVTYQAQLAPWWTLQPDFQYFWMPGGGTINPNNPSRRIPNAAVLGLRTSITF